MKNAVILLLLVGLTGCGKSAQEKVAEEQQMKASEVEVVAGFQKAADDARQAAKK